MSPRRRALRARNPCATADDYVFVIFALHAAIKAAARSRFLARHSHGAAPFGPAERLRLSRHDGCSRRSSAARCATRSFAEAPGTGYPDSRGSSPSGTASATARSRRTRSAPDRQCASGGVAPRAPTTSGARSRTTAAAAAGAPSARTRRCAAPTTSPSAPLARLRSGTRRGTGTRRPRTSLPRRRAWPGGGAPPTPSTSGEPPFATGRATRRAVRIAPTVWPPPDAASPRLIRPLPPSGTPRATRACRHVT